MSNITRKMKRNNKINSINALTNRLYNVACAIEGQKPEFCGVNMLQECISYFMVSAKINAMNDVDDVTLSFYDKEEGLVYNFEDDEIKEFNELPVRYFIAINGEDLQIHFNSTAIIVIDNKIGSNTTIMNNPLKRLSTLENGEKVELYHFGE